jgi:putative transcriptional regulator
MTKTQVKRLRLALGLKQAELARELCVSRSLVNHWETGERVPNGPALILLKQMHEALKELAE